VKSISLIDNEEDEDKQASTLSQSTPRARSESISASRTSADHDGIGGLLRRYGVLLLWHGSSTRRQRRHGEVSLRKDFSCFLNRKGCDALLRRVSHRTRTVQSATHRLEEEGGGVEGRQHGMEAAARHYMLSLQAYDEALGKVQEKVGGQVGGQRDVERAHPPSLLPTESSSTPVKGRASSPPSLSPFLTPSLPPPPPLFLGGRRARGPRRRGGSLPRGGQAGRILARDMPGFDG